MLNQPGILSGLLILAALAAAGVFALASPAVGPPAVVPASAEPTAFSAERARVHLREITRRPRPVGSAFHAETRAYLLHALQELGLDPEVQHATGLRRTEDTVLAATVFNVMARLPGTDSTGAVVLMSHYDSVPPAPGAGDAGNGVATILETIRALRAGPPLRNDLIVLITDAEEAGLLGAQAWVDEHPWAADTGIVLNLEGRGHTGPVQMFRTTGDNGKMIRTLALAAPFPAAESLANDLFRLMPNDTDLTVFERAGYNGMDFANAHGLTHYHSPLDNFDNADPRTLQHHGSYLLPLARAFGDMNLAELAAPDRIYFSLPAVGLVHYPLAWATTLAVLATLLVFVAAAWAHRRCGLRAGGVLLGLLFLAGALVALPLLALGSWRLLAGLIPEVGWFEHGSPYDSGRYLLGIGLMVAALYAAMAGSLARRLGAAEMLLAALLLWTVLAVASAWWLPGGSYVFVWPLLFATAGLALWAAAAGRSTVLGVALLVFIALPAVMFVLPLMAGIEVALTLRQIPLPVALLVLGLGLLALQLELLWRSLGPTVPVLLAAAGVAVLVMALQQAVIDAERKKPNSVHYLADLDDGEARWYSLDPVPDEWTRHYLGAEPERGLLPMWAPPLAAGPSPEVWQRRASVVRAAGPQAELLAETPVGEGRRLRFRITVPEGSYSTVVYFPQGPGMHRLWIDGREVESDPARDHRPPRLLYFGMPQEGAELEIITTDAGPVEVAMRANIPGLPPTEEGAFPVRPDHLMEGGRLGDLTRLQQAFTFP
jgi:hypothetical protein